MAQDANNVSVAGDGIVAVGPLTATAPTGLGALPAGFVDLGYVSDDGVTEESEKSIDYIRAWQRNDVVRTSTTEASLKFSFKLIEVKKEVVEFVYGVTIADDGSFVKVPGRDNPRVKFILDVIDGDRLERQYAPSAQVTEIAEINRQNGEAFGYEVTVETFYSAEIEGNAKVWDTQLGATAPEDA